MANQRWHSDKNIEFIKEYQHHRCLWDSKNNQYKVRRVREAAYKSIMEAMNMESVKDVISKIRTLRNTYNNETLKATKKRNSTGELYISKIPWLSHLDFIKNNMENTENVVSFIKLFIMYKKQMCILIFLLTINPVVKTYYNYNYNNSLMSCFYSLNVINHYDG